MNNSKKINVNFSSLVGLKAELLRKQMEVQDAKAKVDSTTLQVPKIKLKNKKKNVSKEKTNKVPEVTEIEDVNMLKKSKYMLQAKSKLYEKLKKSHGDGDHHYLVDFENKSDESEDDIHKEEDYDDENSDPEEDWVEYQDCFGRTRKCLRRDLPRMMDKDNLVKKEITKDPPEEHQQVEKPIFIEPEKEPEIVMMRKKWEEQTERLSHKTDIHYQDILFDEARSHGVGYFAFSQDESERAKQQAELAKLRKETEERQKELQKIKDLKQKMEQNRLKAARIRQRIRAGLPAESDDEKTVETNSEQPTKELSQDMNAVTLPSKTDESDENSEQPEKEEQSLAVIEDKIKAFGELLGKRPKWHELSQEEWIEKRRKDRHGEFAPVYDNFKSAGFLKQVQENKDYQLLVKESNSNDPLRIPGSGPEPTDLWESSGIMSREQNDPVSNETDQSSSGQNVDEFNSMKDQNIRVNNALQIQKNLLETSVPVCPVPPPLFDTSISPPSIISAIPPLPIIPSMQPLVNSNYIPIHNDFYHVPPSCPDAFISKTLSNQSLLINSNTKNSLNLDENEEHKDKSCDKSDSDDSEIIGPMPPTLLIDNSEDLSQIPLPSDSNACINVNKTIINVNKETNLNVDRIAAGLKYLRQQFDNNHHS
ncbi:coiled-coil domain-containing protein 174 [Chelonus insularis]|uniref:coiled-coil domain-containing protein 174 n=1 Tax=Chelonus insularis TaxID=460826 RepID=UPI00158D72DD|nr:coiled-coil domain-containing protein 174 [Chelonus insularis]